MTNNSLNLILVIGASKVGKTSICKIVSENTGFPVVSMGWWIRGHFAELGIEDPPRQDMLDFAREALQKDQNHAVNQAVMKIVELRYPEKGYVNDNFIIEGIRNPQDFCSLWSMANQNRSKVVFLQNSNASEKPNVFDNGVSIIRSICEWKVQNGLMKDSQIINVEVNSYSKIPQIGKLLAEMIQK
jgi:cytidylate kinase